MAEDLRDELSGSLATRNNLAIPRVDLKMEMAGLRADFRALRADFGTLRAEVKAEIAAFERRLTQTLILTQVGGFVALAVLILLR